MGYASLDAAPGLRQRAVARIAHQLSAVVSRRIGLALGLWGEPGIGKTHAARVVLEGVPCRHVTLHATADAAQIVGAIPRAKSLPGWVVAQLERVERGDPLEPQTLAALLLASAPFVLHLEDVHEADPQRVALIEGLARAVGQTRGVALLVTSRNELPAPFLNHRLEPLTRTETVGVLTTELKSALPEASLEWLLSRTGGNPLFALEFSRYLRRQGFLWSDGERWHWRSPTDDFVPITVEALIAQFVSSLTVSNDAQIALRARALLPSQLNGERLVAVWAAVAGLTKTQLERSASELERCGVMDGRGIVHPLIAETITRELTSSDRTPFARRALDALGTLEPLLAVEYLSAATLAPAAAVAWLERRALELQTQGDSVDAAQLLGLAAERAGGADRGRLALAALAIVSNSGDYRTRERLARVALEVQPDNDEARLELGLVLAQRGEVTALEALLEVVPPSERDELRWLDLRFRAFSAAQCADEALSLWHGYPQLTRQPHGRSVSYAIDAYCGRGELALAESLTLQTLERDDLLPRTRGLLLDSLAFIRSDQGRYDEASELHNQAITLKRQDGHASNLASGLYECAVNLDRLGRLGDAETAITESIELYDLAGSLRYGSNARAFMGHLLSQRGDFERAETILLEAYAGSERLGNSINLVNCACTLALLYSNWRPAHGAALAWKFVRIALRAVGEIKQTLQISQVSSIAAHVAAWQGDGDQAMAFAIQARESLGKEATAEEHYGCLVAMAQALEASGDLIRALETWNETHACAQTLKLPLQMRESELEIARFGHDWQGVRQLLEWFEREGRGLLANRARRYLPQAPSVRNALEVSVSPARLNVLGAVTLERDGEALPTRAKKRLEILAYLLETRIGGRSEASVLELLDALYAGEPETEARNTLKQQVYLIRSTLGADSIVSTPSGYALGNVSSDAEDTLRLHDSGLWRGAYLANLGDGWRAGVREALLLELHSSIETLMLSDVPEAARLGAILIDMEPYDSSALHLAVRALEAAGDLRGAGRVFADGRTRLQDIGEVVSASLEIFAAVQTRS